jgi:DNA-directed RNA polymerase subunit RPC12/RpoP
MSVSEAKCVRCGRSYTFTAESGHPFMCTECETARMGCIAESFDAALEALRSRCDHRAVGGTLEPVGDMAYRCTGCGMLFAVGAMGKGVKR